MEFLIILTKRFIIGIGIINHLKCIKQTKKSTWEKPDCLKTAEEKLNSTDWQECSTSDGRTFYYNAKLKKSLWNMPPELKAIKEKQVK